MSTTSDHAARRRAGRTVTGLARSLVPAIAILLLIVWWQRGEASPVQQVDPGPDIQYAERVSPVPLPAPRALPSDWRATSAHVDAPAGEKRSPVTLTVGYLTGQDRYAEVVIGDRTPTVLLKENAAGATADGAVDVGPARWQRYRTDRGETVLVTTVGRAGVLVTGDAADPDLLLLAGSVR